MIRQFNGGSSARANAMAMPSSMLGLTARQLEEAHADGIYHAELRGAKPQFEREYKQLFERKQKQDLQITRLMQQRLRDMSGGRSQVLEHAFAQRDELTTYMRTLEETKALREAPNTVLTLGKNYLEDNGLAGSAYTAAFFMFLISSVSFSAIVVGDSAASHAGWLEAGGATAPTYSGARKTAAWAAASAGSKALSAGLVYTFTGSGTVKGCGLGTTSTVDSTTGTFYSAGLFTGGDQPVVATNTLTVTYTASL